MIRYLRKVLFISLPVIIGLIFIEVGIRYVPNDYSYKNNYLSDTAKKINTLVLGSSHAFFGVDPQYFGVSAFNAAHVSQTLNYDYYILSKVINKKKNLKIVILPISYFTMFSSLEKGLEKWRVKEYSIYYGFDYYHSIDNDIEIADGKLLYKTKCMFRYWFKDKDRITCSDLGFGLTYSSFIHKDLQKSGQDAAKRHTKDQWDELIDNQMYLDKIIKLCSSHDISLVLYTPPAWYTYRDLLDKAQYSKMKEIALEAASMYNHVSYLSYFDDARFLEGDFYDADHLNEKGAKKLTLILDIEINKILN